MRDYYEAFGTKELAPHVFALASDAYKSLCMNHTSQTIVTSGESGSGKTENSKQVFRFLAEIAGVQTVNSTGEPTGTVSLAELLVHSNPVLEAFGNAKTLRNDNSSRFGKLVNVHFDGSGKIIGATTRNYLLEKTRVAAPPQGERNYHAFYQLIAGLSPDDKSSRGLNTVAAHRLLSGRGVERSIEGVDDTEEWEFTKEAMEKLGFEPTEVSAIIDITAACLVLADATIESDKGSGAPAVWRDGVKVAAEETEKDGNDPSALSASSKEVLQVAAKLLGVDADELGTALISLKVRDTTNILSVTNARANRDAFVAGVYSKLFDRIVERINGAAGDAADDLTESSRFIGVLDIFGFEIFQTNSFEQLCINFCNEKLQRNFTETTFNAEEGLYTEEGISFEKIPYTDNTATLELLDLGGGAQKLGAARGARGILQILDEEVHLPNTTDATFLSKLQAAFGTTAGSKSGGHPAYTTDFKRPGLFTVSHYAGKVEYNPKGFLEKSEESIALGLVTACKNSSKPLVASLFTLASSRRSIVANDKGSRKPTVGIKFSKQLAALVATIEETQAHFIRCIKPNTIKSPDAFEPKLTLEQLRYSGVFEAVQIRKSGFPFRLPHRQFAHRYSCVLPPSVSAGLNLSDGAIRATCEKMVKELLPTAKTLLEAEDKLAKASAERNSAAPPAPAVRVDLKDVRVGKGRTFYRAHENRVLELAREAAIVPRLRTMQRFALGLACRGAKRRLRAAKSELEAATQAMELHRMEAALTAATTPQRGFYQNKPLEFLLFLPNRQQLTQLVADLREEERLEPSLTALCSADDLAVPGSESYEKLKAELLVGKRLKEALGREVPHLAAAECVVGLTEGVLEHDHERLGAAMATATKLGYAEKLSVAMERAQAEAARLEAGKVVEAKLRAELTSHTSVYGGKGGWDHSGIQTSGLQAAHDEAIAFPLVSKQGVQLIADAALSLQLRPLLLADDWAGLVAFLEDPSVFPIVPNVDRKMACPAEIRAAWNELDDQMEARTSKLQAALASGKSIRTGEYKWDHKSIATQAVADAVKAVEAFPYKTQEGDTLLATAAAVLPIRKALPACDWAKADSWGGLAQVLEMVPQPQRECEEVQAAWSEFFEVRAMLEANVTKHLDLGRSVKRTGAGQVGWSHDELATDALAAAQAELDTFARPSDESKSLSMRASRAIPIRKALLTAKWPDHPDEIRTETASTWDGVAKVVEQLGEPPIEMGAGRAHDEALMAAQELDEARAYYEGLVRREMERGRSVKAGAVWDHNGLSTDNMQMAILECMDFLQTTRKASTEEVLAIANLIVELRSHLENSVWEEPAEWAGLADFLEAGIDAEMRELDEVVAAKQELTDRRLYGEKALADALDTGRSVAKGGNQPWSHDKIETTNLAAALDGVRSFPRVSDEGTALAARAEWSLKIRTALLEVVEGQAATWGSVWRTLNSVPAEMRDDDEIGDAWEEVLAARIGFEQEVKKALAKNRSMRTDADRTVAQALASTEAPPMLGKSARSPSRSLTMSSINVNAVNAALDVTRGVSKKPWSHAELSHTMVGAAVAELRAFPKLSDSGASLCKLADAMIELRTALAAAPWEKELSTDPLAHSGYEKLASWLENAANGPYAREEEVVAAMQEFADKRMDIEGKARAALDVGRSEPPTSSDGSSAPWSHAKLDVDGLTKARAELTAFPRSSESGKALAKLLHVVVSLREALASCDWESSASWAPLADALETSHCRSLASAEPIAQVQAEFDAKRAQTEAMAQSALDTGRATPMAAGGWDHSVIRVDALNAARAELDAFPRVSEAGRKLSALCGIAVDIRDAQVGAMYNASETWTELAMCLDAHSGRAEAAGMQELIDAQSDFDYARTGFEAAVSRELENGRVTRRPSAGSPPTAEGLAGQWDHSTISSVALIAAIVELDTFPRNSQEGMALSARATVARFVREAVVQCSFERSSSWSALYGAIDQAARGLSPDQLDMLDDFKLAQDELNDARLYTELNVKSAMAARRSVKSGGKWSHAELSATDLIGALAELDAFPRMSDEGKALGAQAKQVISIRVALSKADWESAGTWSSLANALDVVPADHSNLEEIASARAELADKRDDVAATLSAEMGRGCSIKTGGDATAQWDHTSMSTAALDAAVMEAQAFPRPGAEFPRLIADAKTVSSLRTALAPAKVGDSASWGRIAALLGGAASESSTADELDEVRNAWAEVRGARDAAQKALANALATNFSVSIGEATSWDHDKLDARALLAAAAELEAFPKIGAAAAQASAATAGSPTFSRRPSMLARRQSIVRVTEVGDQLVASARTIAKLRELLLTDSWKELHNMLGSLERSTPLHELCVEEARRASVELQDNLAMLENNVRSCLEANRSKRQSSPPLVGGVPSAAWDHSELTPNQLRDAMNALRAFPLQGPASAGLIKLGELIVRIREALASTDHEATAWGELVGILGSVTDADLMQNDEVRNAGIELEEMRAWIETELKAALESGRSLKIVGKPVKVFIDKSQFLPVSWDHTSMNEGVERLKKAVATVSAFPGVKERQGIGPLLELASLIARLRTLILKTEAAALVKTNPWEELLQCLEAITIPSHLLNDEVVMARQEYLTYELERASKALDQKALKVGLAMATSAGMLTCEKPVYHALGVFIDPPEFVINLPKPPVEGIPVEVGPDASGELHLKVKIRGAKTIQWMKNGIALKEGGDGGRVTGVEGQELKFSKMFGRDEGMLLQCVAKNKFGIVKSHIIKVRLGAAPIDSLPPPEEKRSSEVEEEDSEADPMGFKRRASLTVMPLHGDL